VLYKHTRQIDNAEDEEAVRKAMEDYNNSVDEAEKRLADDAQRRKDALQAKLAARKRKSRQDLKDKHGKEALEVGDDDPTLSASMLLRQKHEKDLNEAELISYENEVNGQIDAMAKVTEENIATLKNMEGEVLDEVDPSKIVEHFEEHHNKLNERMQDEVSRQREALRRKLEAQKKRRAQQQEQLKDEVTEQFEERHEREMEAVEEMEKLLDEAANVGDDVLQDHLASSSDQVNTVLNKIKDDAVMGDDVDKLLKELSDEEKRLKRTLDADADKSKARLQEQLRQRKEKRRRALEEQQKGERKEDDSPELRLEHKEQKQALAKELELEEMNDFPSDTFSCWKDRLAVW